MVDAVLSIHACTLGCSQAIKDTYVPFGNTIFDIIGCNLGTPEVGQAGGGGDVAIGAYAGQAGFS